MTHAEELKSSGLKATLPRIKILEVFQRTRNAPGALYSVAGKTAGNLGWDQPARTAN